LYSKILESDNIKVFIGVIDNWLDSINDLSRSQKQCLDVI